jgi:hypothetical protein
VRTYSSVSPAAVRALACGVIRQVADWKPFRQSMAVRPMLRLLAFMGATGRSLSAVVKAFNFGVSHETARRAIRDCLPKAEALGASISKALADLAAPDLAGRKRGWRLAIDLHNAPFYGDSEKEGVVGGPKKGGTKFSFCYATACVVEKRRRYTLAVVPVLEAEKPHETLARVLEQVRASGVKIRSLALDSGFDSGEVYLMLQRGRIPYVVPVRRKGKGSNSRNDWFDQKPGTLGVMAWRVKDTREEVSTPVAVWCRPGRDRSDVFAYWGWSVSDARQAGKAAARYRQRFGIETSYRQMNECKPPTSSCDPAYRMLLIGVALILRQCWVWVTARTEVDPNDWVPEWTLARQLDWLGRAVQSLHPEPIPPSLNRPITVP